MLIFSPWPGGVNSLKGRQEPLPTPCGELRNRFRCGVSARAGKNRRVTLLSISSETPLMTKKTKCVMVFKVIFFTLCTLIPLVRPERKVDPTCLPLLSTSLASSRSSPVSSRSPFRSSAHGDRLLRGAGDRRVSLNAIQIAQRIRWISLAIGIVDAMFTLQSTSGELP